MISYTVDKWIRFALASAAFAMALVLTPGALLDASTEVNTEKIPVDALDRTDDCLWCTPVDDWNPEIDCDDEENDRLWLNPDEASPASIDERCHDLVTIPDYS